MARNKLTVKQLAEIFLRRIMSHNTTQEGVMRTDEAVEFFGDKITLAKAIGITPQSVSGWGDLVPTSRVKSVRLAMKERAEQLEAEAKRLRRKAKEE